MIIDGGKGLRAAVRQAWGASALVQRCQWHKREHVVRHLPKGEQPPLADGSLLSQDQFSLLGIMLAFAAYTAVVRQTLSQKVHDPHKRTELLRGSAHSRSSFLARTLELLVVADGLLIVAGTLLVLRTFLWARGQATEALWGWFDLDRLIVAQAGMAFLFLAGPHVRAWVFHWMSRGGPR